MTKAAQFIRCVGATRSAVEDSARDQLAAEWRSGGMDLAEIAERLGLSVAGAYYAARRGTPDWRVFGRVMAATLRHRGWLMAAAPRDYEQTVWVAVVAASSYQSSGIQRDRTKIAMRLAGSLLDQLAHDLGFTRRKYADGRRWEKAEVGAGRMADMDSTSESWTEWRKWARRYDGRSTRPKGDSIP